MCGGTWFKMDFLLDTHILLWMFFYPEKVSPKVVEALRNNSNIFFYSIASIWEIAIKHLEFKCASIKAYSVLIN